MVGNSQMLIPEGKTSQIPPDLYRLEIFVYLTSSVMSLICIQIDQTIFLTEK